MAKKDSSKKTAAKKAAKVVNALDAGIEQRQKHQKKRRHKIKKKLGLD